MVANVTVRLPVVHEPGSFLMSLVVLFKFLNRICAFAPSRSVSLLTSGPKRPAKSDKNGVKKTSTIVPVGKLQFFYSTSMGYYSAQFCCLAYTDTNTIQIYKRSGD